MFEAHRADHPASGGGCGGAPGPAANSELAICPVGRCIVCGAPAEGGEVANGCRAHVAAAAALHPGRAWRGDVDAEAEKDADLRNRILKAARIQTGEDERNFFTEDVGTDTVVGGRWVINRIPIPVEKFLKETGRFPSAM